MSGHWGNRGGWGLKEEGEGGQHKPQGSNRSILYVDWKKPASAENCNAVKTLMMEHNGGLYDTPMTLVLHQSVSPVVSIFLASSSFFWSLSFPPSPTPRRIKCIRGAIHLLALSDTGTGLSADRKGPIKHWRKGNPLGHLILFSTTRSPL